MNEELFYCYNCGEYTMQKDADGIYFCPNCHFVADQYDYDDLSEPGAKYEMYAGVYPQAVNSLGEDMVCPYCGSPILERGSGDYICSGNDCCYDPNEDPHLFDL